MRFNSACQKALIGLAMLVMHAPVMAADISFKRDITPIFEAQCVACHLTGKEPGKLALAPQKAYASLVNKVSNETTMKRVVPGDADASYLMRKLNGTHAEVGGQGVRMAFGAKPLTLTQRRLIQDWIMAGAPNN